MRELVESFSVSVADFAGGLRFGIKVEPPTPEQDAESTATQYVDGHVFKSAEGVLTGMRTLLAIELAAEPCVRKESRAVDRQYVTLSTKPTPAVCRLSYIRICFLHCVL